MKRPSPKTNWWIDAVLLGSFLVAFLMDLTGLSLHQWLGLAVGILAAYHLLVHWTWVKSVTRRFFKQTCGRARLCYLVDAGVMGGLGLIVGTGLVISTWLSLPLANYDAWHHLHIMASIVTLLLVVLKVGLHWRWIVTVARRSLVPASAPVPPLQPAPAGATLGRREFLTLMGVVGVTSVVAISQAMKALHSASLTSTAAVLAQSASQPAATGVTPATATATPTPLPTASATSTPAPTAEAWGTGAAETSATCQVQCPRGCFYPGHCRRYTDSNGNGRCDRGECL